MRLAALTFAGLVFVVVACAAVPAAAQPPAKVYHLIGAHVSTFALGHFALQVFVERRTADYRGDFAVRPGPWKDALIEIWPPSTTLIDSAALIWPPRVGLDHDGFEALFDRFLSLSGQRGSYRPNSAFSRRSKLPL